MLRRWIGEVDWVAVGIFVVIAGVAAVAYFNDKERACPGRLYNPAERCK